jgi:hypothetical protein
MRKLALIPILALLLLCQQPSLPVRDLQGAGVPAVNCTTGMQYFRTDAVAGQNLYLCTAANVWTSVASGSGAVWTEYTVDYTNAAFKVASTTATVTLFQLPANGAFEKVRRKHSVAFAGAGITAVTCTIGDGTTADIYGPAFDVFQAVSDTAQLWDAGAFSSTAAAHNVVLTFTANVNFGTGAATVLTGGSLDAHIATTVLP